MNDTTEEKTLPATAKKLRDARKKGQVARSMDLVAAAAIGISILYLYFALPRIETNARGLIDQTSRIHETSFSELWPRAVELAFGILALTIFPIVTIVCIVVLITSLITMHGPVFSFEPVKPNFDHINPVNGFKRIFSARSVIEFAKALAKVVALTSVIIVVLLIGLQSLLESPRCGPACVYAVFFGMLKPLVIATLIAFVIVGIADVGLQRWLFLRDMRMTKSEFKRELKDMEGDPLIKRERQRQRRELSGRMVKVGLRNATLLLGRRNDFVVGLRFVRGETVVPVIVCKARPEHAKVLIDEANSLRVPVIEQPQLARTLCTSCAVGDAIPQTAFQPVADALVAARLI